LAKRPLCREINRRENRSASALPFVDPFDPSRRWRSPAIYAARGIEVVTGVGEPAADVDCSPAY